MTQRLDVFFLGLLLVALAGAPQPSGAAEPDDVNYSEERVPAYVLPDPLLALDGTRITDPAQWQKKRRPEILRLYQAHVFGRSPTAVRPIEFEVASVDRQALGGRATRKQITVFLTGNKSGPKMSLLLYLPNRVPLPVPAFLGLNFYGNHCIHSDPGIELSQSWMRPTQEVGIVNHRATEASRGSHASKWQVEMVIDRGYALATAYYGDIEPDFPLGWKMGLRAALGERLAPVQAHGWYRMELSAPCSWYFGLADDLPVEDELGVLSRRLFPWIFLGRRLVGRALPHDRFGSEGCRSVSAVGDQ